MVLDKVRVFFLIHPLVNLFLTVAELLFIKQKFVKNFLNKNCDE